MTIPRLALQALLSSQLLHSIGSPKPFRRKALEATWFHPHRISAQSVVLIYAIAVQCIQQDLVLFGIGAFLVVLFVNKRFWWSHIKIIYWVSKKRKLHVASGIETLKEGCTNAQQKWGRSTLVFVGAACPSGARVFAVRRWRGVMTVVPSEWSCSFLQDTEKLELCD